MLWACTSLLIRSAVVLGGAEALRRLGSRRTAAYRHQVLLTGILLLLSWPVWSAFLPEIPVALWTVKPVIARVTVEQRVVSMGIPEHTVRTVNWPLTIWLAGFLLALTPAGLGYVHVRRMVQRARPLEDRRALDLVLQERSRLRIRKQVSVRIHAAPVMPFAFGLRRPQIILPAEWLEWPSVRQRSVLVHELAHVKRHDLFWQLLANIATALWWFQPLSWWTRRNLRHESELACDTLVIESGIRPSDYASDLLAIAKAFGHEQRWPSAAIAMARPGELEGRLHAMLDRQVVMPRKLGLAAVAALSALTITASAITILPEQSKSPGGYTMKRTLLSSLLTAAGLSAATIGGSVFDPSGTAIANAQASLSNPDTSVQQETTTSPDGKFTFDALPAGSYILRVEKAGFAPLYREFNVQQDSDVQRGLVLEAASSAQSVNGPGSTRVAEPLPSNPKVLRVKGTIAESNLVHRAQPVYPAAAKESHTQGTVELDVTISKEGVPVDIRVLRSPSEDLTKSALEAVRQWRYRPTLLNGAPVEIVTDVIVNYTLSQ